MLLLTKNPTIFRENIQKLNITLNLFSARHGGFIVLYCKNKFHKNFFCKQFIPLKYMYPLLGKFDSLQNLVLANH